MEGGFFFWEPSSSSGLFLSWSWSPLREHPRVSSLPPVAAEKPDQSEWENSHTEQGEPAFEPMEPVESVCKQIVCSFLPSKGPLGWGTEIQGLRALFSDAGPK